MSFVIRNSALSVIRHSSLSVIRHCLLIIKFVRSISASYLCPAFSGLESAEVLKYSDVFTANQIKTTEIVEFGREVFEQEIACLENIASRLDGAYSNAVMALYQCAGRVIVTGIGKSAIIGQKIVATFNSTGTPAIFMHAADAIHGDLGSIRQDDVIILLSKSGDTAEIKALLPIIQTYGNTTIAIVSNVNSSLARTANISLIIPIDKEADPNNLAPTASTTAQLVMGDALAVTLLRMRGFTPEDFAKYHPGGHLGKQLLFTVRDLCLHNLKPSVNAEATLHEVIVSISTGRLGATAVLKGSDLIGIITDGDLRRMLERHNDFSQMTASEIMSPSPQTIRDDEPALRAFKIMQEKNITQLLVVNGESYNGVIHLHDLIREGFV